MSDSDVIEDRLRLVEEARLTFGPEAAWQLAELLGMNNGD